MYSSSLMLSLFMFTALLLLNAASHKFLPFLLVVELMMLNLMSVTLTFNNCPDYSFLLLLLVMSTGEASVGLSLLVSGSNTSKTIHSTLYSSLC